MVKKIETSIVQTLVYADLFDYPLSKDELWRYLISETSFSFTIQSFNRVLGSLSSLVQRKEGYYFLKNRNAVINIRKRRQEESVKKLLIINDVSKLLSFIPTVMLIGISGALAMNNVEKEDDIDLFIVVKKNTLWITRLVILMFLEILGKRRKRGDKNVSNKICVNMFFEENALEIAIEKRDLYSAHEIVQMKPLFQRKDTYKKFIYANKWIERFLPNSTGTLFVQRINARDALFENVLSQLFILFNFVAKEFQVWYINKHKTVETVSDQILAFHPKDYRNTILNRYKNSLKKYV